MRRTPVFLTFAEAIEIHQYQIAHFGGDLGIREVDLLRSALAMPSATFDGRFLHADLAEMAAAYLFHITEDHPFVDGNKRTGAMAAIIFLDLNGCDFDASDAELTENRDADRKRENDKGGTRFLFQKAFAPPGTMKKTRVRCSSRCSSGFAFRRTRGCRRA